MADGNLYDSMLKMLITKTYPQVQLKPVGGLVGSGKGTGVGRSVEPGVGRGVEPGVGGGVEPGVGRGVGGGVGSDDGTSLSSLRQFLKQHDEGGNGGK